MLSVRSVYCLHDLQQRPFAVATTNDCNLSPQEFQAEGPRPVAKLIHFHERTSGFWIHGISPEWSFVGRLARAKGWHDARAATAESGS